MTEERQNVRWDLHQSHLQTMFSHQKEEGRFCDVILACEGGLTLKAHRSILCACSAYFDSVLGNASLGKETVVIIKDCNFKDIKLIVEFMYNGEISVEKNNICSLQKTAEDLQIKGLSEALKRFAEVSSSKKDSIWTDALKAVPGPSSPNRKRPRSPDFCANRDVSVRNQPLPSTIKWSDESSIIKTKSKTDGVYVDTKSGDGGETNEKYNLWLANQQKIFETIARIEAKMKSLTQKHDQIMTGPSTSEVTLIQKMKIVTNLEELEQLEENLKSDDYMRSVIQGMKTICGENCYAQGFNCCYTLVDHLFARKFINSCSWSGGSRIPDTKKIAFKMYTRTIRLFYELVHLADSTFTEMKMQQFLQSIIKNSARRCLPDGPKRQSKSRRRSRRQSKQRSDGYTGYVCEGESEVIDVESDDDDLCDTEYYPNNDEEESCEVARADFYADGPNPWKAEQ